MLEHTNITLDVLEIRILLNIYEKEPLNKTRLGRLSQKYTSVERERALKNLLTNQLIIEKQLPKPRTNKLPIFYYLTDRGKAWVKDYLDNYPKE